MEIHTRQKFICHFDRYDAKAKLLSQKSFVRVTRAGVFIWEKFHQVTEISVAKTEISVTEPAIEIFTKQRVAKRDLGMRASSVDRAHMKRPLDNVFSFCQQTYIAPLPILAKRLCTFWPRKVWTRAAAGKLEIKKKTTQYAYKGLVANLFYVKQASSGDRESSQDKMTSFTLFTVAFALGK